MGNNAPSILSNQVLGSNFTLAEDSLFSTGTTGFCKPDISAYGTQIQYGDIYVNGSNWNDNTGTSFSTPEVSGIIAQLCSEFPSLKCNIPKVKALLAATAVYRANNTSSLDQKSAMSELYDRQGAGIVNAKCAYQTYNAGKTRDITLGGYVSEYSFTLNIPSSYTYLCLAMVWNKKVENVDATLTGLTLANYDISIFYNGNLVACSENVYSNLELLQFAVTQGGTYTIKIYNRSYQLYGEDLGEQNISIAWY